MRLSLPKPEPARLTITLRDAQQCVSLSVVLTSVSLHSTDYMFTHMNLVMSNIEYLRQQLEYAEEQLMIADDMYSKLTWGNRCDALEAALADAEAA